MSKTQEELQKLKEEFKTLNNKLNELNEDELKKVTGGTSIKETTTFKENTYNYGSKSPKGLFENKCEPNVLPAMIKHEGRLLEGQKVECSDLAFKGTKPECQNCNANK